MDYAMEMRWRQLLSQLEQTFGEKIELEAILFLIGVQELGAGRNRFRKEEKLDLMHIGICTVLEPYGYYRLSHHDQDGWPHFETLKKLPYLESDDQKTLMKRAIIDYFEGQGIIQ